MPEKAIYKLFEREVGWEERQVSSKVNRDDDSAFFGNFVTHPECCARVTGHRQTFTVHISSPNDENFIDLPLLSPPTPLPEDAPPRPPHYCGACHRGYTTEASGGDFSLPASVIPRESATPAAANDVPAKYVNKLKIRGRISALARGKELLVAICNPQTEKNFLFRVTFCLEGHCFWIPTEWYHRITSSTPVSRGEKSFAFPIPDDGTCQGISRVYNAALGMSHLPEQSRLHLALNGDLVLDAFLLHAILHDKHKRRETLSLQHTGYQNHRFDEELAARNYRMAGTGQDMWAHACHRCMKIYQGEDGRWYRLTAGVHDGVNVRHLCCGVHDCFEALPSQRAHFCQTHSHLAQICGVQGCNLAAEPGFRTCTTESHRALQKDADERNTAMFQLRSRLRRAGIPTVPLAGADASTPTTTPNTSADPDPFIVPPSTLTSTNANPSSTSASTTKLKAKLTRSWTHNEQLFVRCCGIIISRATLFGSESVTGTKVFLKATFPPEYPGSKPTYVFYDNNCSLLKHLRSSGDHYFNDVGLPVDVFHFKCKHSEGDVFCQTHCNPARFRELIGADGKWIFNSSAAEQANVWFGKYQNIVQDMPVLKYNFYLDEMIAIHNEQLATQLRAEGQAPHLQSESLLRGGFPFLKSDVINVETQ